MEEYPFDVSLVDVLRQYAKQKSSLSCPEDALRLLRLIKHVNETIAESSFYIVVEPRSLVEGELTEEDFLDSNKVLWVPLAYEEEGGPYLFASSTHEGAIAHLSGEDHVLYISSEDCYHRFFEGSDTLKGILFDPDEDFYTLTREEFIEAREKGPAYEEKWHKMEQRLEANVKRKKPN